MRRRWSCSRARLLEYRDRVYPDQDWHRFPRGEAGAREPDWTRILVGGHSQGAGHVAYLNVWTRMLGELVYRNDFE